MGDIVVECSAGRLSAFGETMRCAIGRSGAVPAGQKREGDGATPLGRWALCGALLRPGVAPPPPAMPWRWLRPWDGWSDDPADPAYNRPVCHPHRFSAEHLWRADAAYDIIIVLDCNAACVPGGGSAIFWHVAQPDFRPTEGCVAIERARFARLLPRLSAGMLLDIRP
jgi:L,D-peptidoglycan transpeptidase YkuD (ErfK/YbiS/YcfS/YnhG family)